jgi:hypothetical protein
MHVGNQFVQHHVAGVISVVTAAAVSFVLSAIRLITKLAEVANAATLAAAV